MAIATATAVMEGLEYFGLTDSLKGLVKASTEKLLDVISDPAAYREQRLLRQISRLQFQHQKLKNMLEIKTGMSESKKDSIRLKMANLNAKAEMLAKRIDFAKILKKGGSMNDVDLKSYKRMLTQVEKKLDDRFNVGLWKYQPTLSSDDYATYFDKVKGKIVFVLKSKSPKEALGQMSKDLQEFKKFVEKTAKRKCASVILLVKDVGGSQCTNLFCMARESKAPVQIGLGGSMCGEKIKQMDLYSK